MKTDCAMINSVLRSTILPLFTDTSNKLHESFIRLKVYRGRSRIRLTSTVNNPQRLSYNIFKKDCFCKSSYFVTHRRCYSIYAISYQISSIFAHFSISTCGSFYLQRWRNKEHGITVKWSKRSHQWRADKLFLITISTRESLENDWLSFARQFLARYTIARNAPTAQKW